MPDDEMTGAIPRLTVYDEPVAAWREPNTTADWDELGRAIQRVSADLAAALRPAFAALARYSVSPGPHLTYDGEDARHAATRRPPADPRLRGSAFAGRGRRR